MLVFEEVSVAVEGGGDRAVPEVALDGLGVRALRDEQRRAGVAKGMEATYGRR